LLGFVIICERIAMFVCLQSRIKDGTYKSLSDLEKDVELLVNNAKTYNEEGSDIYNDAALIQVCMLRGCSVVLLR
jgi:hypothetical protein